MTCQFAGGCTAEATVIVRIADHGDRHVCEPHFAWMQEQGMAVRRLERNAPAPAWRQRDLARDMTRVASALVVALAIAGCTSAPAPTEAPIPTPTIIYVTPAPTEVPVDAPTSPPEETEAPETPLPPAELVPIGTTVRLGDWDVKVTGKVNFNAWKVVAAENQFNDKPPAGMVAVLIPIAATYRGTTARASLNPAAHFVVLGEATATERSMFEGATCGVVPKDIMLDDPTVRSGGKVAGNLCFVVDKDDAKTLVLLWSDDDYGFSGEFTEFALR